jgi:hypothetical protein
MQRELSTVEEATAALVATAERAGALMRQEAERARVHAQRAWQEIESVRSEVQAVRSDVESIRGIVTSSQDDTQHVRHSARRAWTAVAAMAAVIVIAVGWAAATLTRSSTQLAFLNEKVAEWRNTAQVAQAEAARIRDEAQSARIAQARAEGQLKAAIHRPDAADQTPPAPRPGLMTYLSDLLAKAREQMPAAHHAPPSTQPATEALSAPQPPPDVLLEPQPAAEAEAVPSVQPIFDLLSGIIAEPPSGE